MPLQDLTPQLRTRLNRMERAVGMFIIIATLLLVAGFSYYLYHAADRRGWFKIKTVYKTYANSAAGLHEGDPISLMGFEVGRITRITAQPPRGKGSDHNVQIEFEVTGTNYTYIMTDGSRVSNDGSRAKFESSFLGSTKLNVTRGATNGFTIYLAYPLKQMTLEEIRSSPKLNQLRLAQEIYIGTNRVMRPWNAIGLTNKTYVVQGVTNEATIHSLQFSNLWVADFAKLGVSNLWVFERSGPPGNSVIGVWNDKERHYEPFDESTNIYILPPDESPTLTDRAQVMVAQVQAALPSFLALTNQISQVLSNTTKLTGHLDAVVLDVRPTLTNLAVITGNLKNPEGSFGQWVIPTNLNSQLGVTLASANGTMTNVNTNLVALAEKMALSLANVANITSNLNTQLQDNSNLLTHINDIIFHSDQMVEGLKHHWLLRSAFKTPKTNAPASRRIRPAQPPSQPFRSPKDSNH